MQQINFKPYKKGFFKTTDSHRLYWELWGNPTGIPVVQFHGGPGAGFEDKDKRFFDPKTYNVLLFDQRGAGRSKPFASIKQNTTVKLIEDTEKLLKHVGFEKALIVGGSWGATLALVYAITHPNQSLGVIVRGTFLANKEDINYYINGGVKTHFPDVWSRFASLVPEKQRDQIPHYYLAKVKSKDKKVSEKYAFEWAFYECSILRMKTDQKRILKDLKSFSYKSLAPLEAHYMANACFLEEDFILKNADKISHLPVSIIHGRYDFICPPKNAYSLHKKIKGSKLHYTVAGHASSEKENERKLKKELVSFAQKQDVEKG